MGTMTALVLLVVVVAVIAFLAAGRGDAARLATLFRRAAFTLVAAETAFIALFLGGETLTDPGGWTAVGLIAAWLVPLLGLAWLAWRRPDRAIWVLSALTVALVAGSVWFALDPQGWRGVENGIGPIRAIAAFVVVATLGVLGLARAMAAGVLLLVAGLAPVLLGLSRGGLSSLAAVATPAVLVGALYVASAIAASRSTAGRRGPTAVRPG